VVIPREHDLWEARATESYRIVHECLAGVLRELGQPAIVKQPNGSAAAGQIIPNSAVEASAPSSGERQQADSASTVEFRMMLVSPEPGVCFQRAEVFDVIHERSGEKIAGAAQKRIKQGLLFQGSIWKPAVDVADWEAFGAHFAISLAQAAGVSALAAPWPDLNEDELTGLTEQYSSPEWIDYR
jgi:lipoate-protein ligase A